MEEYLRKLKIIDSFTTALKISKSDFINKLTSITDKGNTDFFSDALDIFSANKKEYIGQIDYNSFKIKRRKKFFDTKMNLAVATGTINQHNDQLLIDIEISGFNQFFILYYVLITIFYVLFIFAIGSEDNGIPVFVFPFILLHALLMYSIPYFIMRRSVKNLKYELERELYYLTRQVV